MVHPYLIDAKDWVVNQVSTTAGNIKDSTVQTKDVAIGADDEFNDISRRQLLESTAAAIAGYETVKKVPGAAAVAAEDFPYRIDIEEKGEDQGKAAPEGNGLSGGNSSPVGESAETPYESDRSHRDTVTSEVGLDSYQDVLDGEAERNLGNMIEYMEGQAGRDLSDAEVSEGLRIYEGNKVGFNESTLQEIGVDLEGEAPEDYAITMTEGNGFDESSRQNLREYLESN